ncbi:Ig-like domain-containing protein [Clostridium intestinale]|uniref:Ig group 2 domain-containing protein n=1 Tax=Clostridium intestinale URNW TaxID=1294142 RepID=U2PUR5_9CLOT|nr:Ig-like domain-containing protein [Clostridium intestinale]ERK30185.1 Ig group 2 domain-containing protein [Clostridium intestinale URNW]
MKIQSKKKFIAFSLVLILATIFSLTWIKGSNASAATVGQQLTAPEAGWRRYDDTDARFKYIGNWIVGTNSARYNGSNKCTFEKTGKIQFSFYGSKIRIIGNLFNDRTDSYLSIDGNLNKLSTYGNPTKEGQYLVYEILDLPLKSHTVEYYSADSFVNGTHILTWDAIDIDSDGYLINSVSEILLNKTSLSLNVGETDNLVSTVKPDDASIKNIIWSSNDEGIATVDENGKVTAKKAGNVTITAKTTDGSNLTATCAVTVVQPSNDRGVLAITMTNGQTKEYDLPNSEIEAFANWFDISNGKGQPKFGFTKKIQPYKEVKEYVVFDKISSYEVRTYTVSN